MVIVVVAILSAVILPKFADQGRRSKENALKADLTLLRTAIGNFQNDTGLFPAALSDLTAATAPATGLNASGASIAIPANSWHGPYVNKMIPADPVSGSAFLYTTSGTSTGQVTGSAGGNALDGTAYSTW